MASIYCAGQGHGKAPCESCSAIIDYAEKRIDACRFGDEKGWCSQCSVHCFKPEVREEVRKIMRYAGPRMLLYSPIEAVRHLIATLTQSG